MASFFQIGIYVRKRTGVISLAYASAAVVNIVLNLVLDPVIGVWGAVIATVIASIDLAIVIFIYSQRVMPVPYPVRHVVLVLATYLGLAAVHLLLPEMNTLVLKLGTLIAFSLSIIVAGVVSPAQIRIAIRETRRYLARHLLHRSEPGSA
jgi:O-antigen/teichoic acid export membrane protein